MTRPLRLGLISPRFEPVTAVGAEAQIRELARRLSAGGHRVEVLTTCVRDAKTWKNHYHPGLWEGEGYAVRRFPADPRRVRRRTMETAVRLRRGETPPRAEQEGWIAGRGASGEMAGYLRKEGGRFDAFVAAPALCGTTWGAPREVLRRTLLIGALPDLPESRLPVLAERFGGVACYLSGSSFEEGLAAEAFGLPPERVLRAAAAVEPAAAYDAEAFRRRHGLEFPFLLFAGRRSAGKGIGRLAAWMPALSLGGRALRLVVMGEENLEVPPAARDFVVDLRFVEGRDKADGMAAALALCQPARAEGIALAPMESWLAGRPVLAEAGGGVTVERCRASGGGTWFAGFPEFEEAVRLLFEGGGLADELGRRGRAWVRDNWGWDRVLPLVEEALGEAARRPAGGGR